MVYNHWSVLPNQGINKMTRPLPLEQREKIVSAYDNGLGSIRKIAQIFEITERSVYRYIQQEREKGDLTPQPIPGRPPILTPENLKIIKDIVLANTDGRLEDYVDSFYAQTDIKVTIVTIHNACKILKLNRKKRPFMLLSKNEMMSRKK